MSLINKVERCFRTLYPLCLAESSWDNVGIIVESPKSNGRNILLTIDYTKAVMEEALAKECSVVIAYHPPWFAPSKSLTLAAPCGFLAASIAHGISVFSPHTVLPLFYFDVGY